MNYTNRITVVSSTITNHELQNSKEACDITIDFGLEIILLKSFSELYSMLSDSRFYTKIIGIDIESLYDQGSVSAWNVINTLVTILKSTKYIRTNVSEDKETYIVARITSKTDIKLVKDFLNMDENCIGLFPCGNDFSDEERKRAIEHFLNGKKYIPEIIKEKLKPKRKINRGTVHLTPRQQQIFNFIVERGASNKVIAKTLNLSESTVKIHITAILKKFNLKNRTQLAVFSREKFH